MALDIENLQVGQTVYRINSNGSRSFVCPVEVVRLTKTRAFVRTPKGRECEHWRTPKQGTRAVGHNSPHSQTYLVDLSSKEVAEIGMGLNRLVWSTEANRGNKP